jgi:hypothetical protein
VEVDNCDVDMLALLKKWLWLNSKSMEEARSTIGFSEDRNDFLIAAFKRVWLLGEWNFAGPKTATFSFVAAANNGPRIFTPSEASSKVIRVM